MPSDFEMEDSDSSSTNESLNIDPSILASVTQGRPRVVFKGKEYQRHYGSRGPAMRMAHFRKSWTGVMKSYIQTMEARC
jgi:hypothetical protein